MRGMVVSIERPVRLSRIQPPIWAPTIVAKGPPHIGSVSNNKLNNKDDIRVKLESLLCKNGKRKQRFKQDILGIMMEVFGF
ncbi:hypothetical protein GWI33_010304 [Rhynchophorus ferrugineus]|uniref:Uncharacterized protein n=1 Tax=Rhynchophorus ferrugineus TaxID=354439 RepID=A0A834IV41_RHYFE|nr:hypothetical protein GWI33_010304 [Rhynchophorus ferrugineus]